MQGLTLRRRTKKVLALREGTKKGQKVATPQVDKSDMIQAVHPQQIRLYHTWLRRCRWWKNKWISWWMPSRDGCLTTLTNWSIRWIHHSLHLSLHFPFCRSSVHPSLHSSLHFPVTEVKAYDGSKDPLDHLESFKTLMHLQVVVDEIMCRAFPNTLKGSARVWFSRLMPNSISTFK